MARTKEFEEAEVLHKALETFIAKGYEPTSIQDLVDATGVNRQSLYNAFGDKKALYLKAFDAYCAHMKEKVGGVLRQDKPAREILADYRETVKKIACSPEATRGCLLVNTVTGSTCQDPELKARVGKMFQARDQALADVIARGQKNGDISKKHSPMAVAQMLHAAIVGLSVMARNGAGYEEMTQVIDALFEGIL